MSALSYAIKQREESVQPLKMTCTSSTMTREGRKNGWMRMNTDITGSPRFRVYPKFILAWCGVFFAYLGFSEINA